MRRIALYGGSFDPVHLGHLLCAESARDAFRLDQVIFLPASQSPLKARPKASAKHREAMLRLAIQDNADFSVSTWELEQNRSVYTVETLAHFRAALKTSALYFIVGSDSLASMNRWKGGASLFKQATFLVADRPDRPWASISPRWRRQAKRIPNVPVAIASQDIRLRVAKQKSIRYHVPDSVKTYIQRHRLYA